MSRIIVVFVFFLFSFPLFSQNDNENFIRSKIAEDYNYLDSAVQLLTEAIKIKELPIYYNERANVYFKKSDFKSALSDYLNIIEDTNGIIFYRIACCYSMLDSLEKSSHWLKRYLHEENKIPENIIKTDSLFNNLKRSNEWSVIWLKNWYSTYENYLADLHYLNDKSKINEMYDVIDSAIFHFPDKSDLWLWRAKLFTIGNNPKEAMKSLDMAVKYDSKNVSAIYLRAKMLRDVGKSKKAITDFNAILAIQPWNLKYLKERGFAKIEAEDYNGAVKDLLDYYYYDTLNANILYQVAHATFLKGDYKEAINYYSSAIIKDWGLSDSFFERGRCYQELLDYDNAFSDFCMAIDLKPNKGEYFYYRGLVYYSKKNKIGACHDWEKARSLDYLKAQEYMLRFCSDQK